MAVLANFGSFPDWSPYRSAAIQGLITFAQENVLRANTYIGSWKFVPYDAGRLVGVSGWQVAPYRQDVSSTFLPLSPYNPTETAIRAYPALTDAEERGSAGPVPLLRERTCPPL